MKFLAFDMGASNGRAMLGTLDGGRIGIKELHRFPNDPVRTLNHFHWDTLRLFHEVQTGLVACRNETGSLPDSVGIDTWGVDFGLVDAEGDIVFMPLHYRDECREGIAKELSKTISNEQLFYNSAYNMICSVESLYYLKNKKPDVFNIADTLLFTPDLLSFLLCSRRYAERSISSTSKLLDVEKGAWSAATLKALGVPQSYLPEIVEPGTRVGSIDARLMSALGLEGDVGVIAVAGHDTASAAVAVPAEEEKYAYISCGTWSIIGTKAERVLRTREVFQASGSYDCAADGGVDMRINIVGLWIQQELRRSYAQRGQKFSYAQLSELAAEAEPFIAVIDPDDELFFRPGDMAENIRKFCGRTQQRVPETIGEFNRVVIESLALKYRYTIERMERMLETELPVVYMIGGGIQNEQLCAFTASACGRPVKTGPIEATVFGNFMLQALAMGAVKNVAQGRALIRSSCEIKRYEPQNGAAWDRQYALAKDIFTAAGR